MSIWSDIGDLLSKTAANAFSAVVEGLRNFFVGDAQTRKKVAFSIAIIALSAKMAKADGVVTESEIRAFHDVFSVPNEEMANVTRLYNLAKQDVAGFDAYGSQVRQMFPDEEGPDQEILTDVLDALFHIAKADGVIHENELLFLEDLSVVFGFSAQTFEQIKARHAGEWECDPYCILQADPKWSFPTLKQHYRKRVMESHPDRLIARGVPPEFIVIATDRLAALNTAWEAIERLHGKAPALA